MYTSPLNNGEQPDNVAYYQLTTLQLWVMSCFLVGDMNSTMDTDVSQATNQRQPSLHQRDVVTKHCPPADTWSRASLQGHIPPFIGSSFVCVSLIIRHHTNTATVLYFINCWCMILCCYSFYHCFHVLCQCFACRVNKLENGNIWSNPTILVYFTD